MSSQVMCAGLFCGHCMKETPHIVQYTGPYLRSTTCVCCGHQLRINARTWHDMFLLDLPKRSQRLVKRNVRFALHHPKTFARQLPRNLILKPLAIASELYELLTG